MITTIKTHSSKLMMLSILFFISAFMSNSYGTTLPDSTKNCSTDKKFAVSKTDSTHKDMKMEDMGGEMHKEIGNPSLREKMGMKMNEGMHKEMMAKNDSTSSCGNPSLRDKNKEGMRESSKGIHSDVPSGKDMAMADCKMRESVPSGKDNEKKDCKMEDADKKECKMKEGEIKEGKNEHESHHTGATAKS